MSILQLQQRVLGPETPVDYSTIIMQSYPSVAIQREPFIGFKVKCRDTQSNQYYGGEQRMNQIDAYLQRTRLLTNTGVILRATHFEMSDGLWVITMPVPRSQVTQCLANLFRVLQMLEQYLGIVLTGEDYEINVSGKCSPMETEQVIGSLYIPQEYQRMMCQPVNTAYKYGHLFRINEIYACFRTRWNIGLKPVSQVHDTLMLLSQLISNIYH